MDLGQAMIVAGVGCRKGVAAQEVDAAIAEALAKGKFTSDALTVIATAAGKGLEQGIIKAAAARGVPLVLVAEHDLEAASGRAVTTSERVQKMMGVPSISECAALAAGGPSAQIVVSRVVVGPATCALAIAGDAP
jgi:cobalt-precorrin 5A hydrolase